MLWNYKTFHFSPKMRQMMYPDCKTTLNPHRYLKWWQLKLAISVLDIQIHDRCYLHILFTCLEFPVEILLRHLNLSLSCLTSREIFKTRGGTQIWVGQGCAARASKPLPIFKGDLGRKRYPFLRIFIEK